MPLYNVRVKWNSEIYEVIANTDDSPDVFRAQLFAATGVPPERQKILFKARQLNEDTWQKFTSAGLKDGALLQLMGNADKVPEPPKPVEPENVDPSTLSEEEKRALVKLPAGLKNLGNTCYLNATVQCLRSVPEFTEALKKFVPNDPEERTGLTASMRELFATMDQATKDDSFVTPLMFVMLVQSTFPHLATKDERGNPEQQDANECWVELVQRLARSSIKPIVGSENASSADNFIKQYFRGEMETTLKCKECDDEMVQNGHEEFYTFSCYVSQEVKYLHTGLKAKLTEELTKHSALLNRDAIWEKTSKISRLPAYLTVTIVRFHYKEKERINAKIMKDIKFPFVLDMYDMCTEELRARCRPHRELAQREDDAILERSSRLKSGTITEADIAQWPKRKLSYSFDDDPGSNNTAMYELVGVLTHKGRSSNSGHYVAWVKRNGYWFCCDDDNVYMVNAEDIERLSGGGDWHTAYILLYGPKQITVIDEPKQVQKNGDSEPPAVEAKESA